MLFRVKLNLFWETLLVLVLAVFKPIYDHPITPSKILMTFDILILKFYDTSWHVNRIEFIYITNTFLLRLVYLLWSDGTRTAIFPNPRRSSWSDSVGLRSSLSSSQLSSCLNLKLDSLLKILCMFLLYCLDCPLVLSWTSLSDFRLTRESILLWNYES